MKVRIKFQKFGAMKFVGHLDEMRYFQKAFRRAGTDNEYTKGFTPHQIMSFAAPLGVGLTSDAEYLDLQLLSSDAPEVMMERINAVMTEGFRIIDFRFLLEREEDRKNVTAMALVSSADYLVSLKDGYQVKEDINTPEKFQKAFSQFINRNEIIINKKTKTSEMAVDIKPMITLTAFDNNEYEALRYKTLKDMETAVANNHSAVTSVADKYVNGINVYLQLDTGSSSNLKPELVMEAFCNELGIEYAGFAWQVHRLEIYTREDDSKKLISLDKLER
ncbi:MAG TPA: TIGR03936 family radical SAM-associated protein [Mobilitalea sp.]|nr:TIGR03936 family radical SAM-associated protein [Mobilitalea sp.]